MSMKKKKKLNISRNKTKKLNDAINIKKLTIEKGMKKKAIPKPVTIMNTNMNRNTDPPIKLNAFLFVGVFPILATGALVYLNDDVREDFMRTFGMKPDDNYKNNENNKIQEES
jgi:hypothetical protein